MDGEKDNSTKKSPILSNYRPITCLPTIQKILTAQIKEEIYYFLYAPDFPPKNNKDAEEEQEEQINFNI